MGGHGDSRDSSKSTSMQYAWQRQRLEKGVQKKIKRKERKLFKGEKKKVVRESKEGLDAKEMKREWAST